MKKTDLINIVNDAKNGDRKAFEKLYNEYYSNLYFFVLKNVKNKETAEDITHEAFLKSMEKIDTLDHPENYGTWLHSIAYNKCTDHFRTESRNARFDTDEEKDYAIETTAMDMTVMLPEDYAVNKERKKEIAALIDGLKPEMRSALILYYYNDMSVSDVAKSLGMNENTAKQKLFQARKKLKTQIEKLYGKGGVLAAVPMGDMFKKTISPKFAAARVSAAPAVSSGFLAGKIAAISAAAVLAICLPIGLGMSDKDNKGFAGDVKQIDSKAPVEVSYEENNSIDKYLAEKTESSTDKKITASDKDTDSKTSVPVTSLSNEKKKTSTSAGGNNSNNGSNATPAVNTVTNEKKTNNKKVTADDLIGTGYNEIKNMAGTSIPAMLTSSIYGPHTVQSSAEINGSKWSMTFEISDSDYAQIASNIGSYSQRGWERVSEYANAVYAYVDLSDFDPVCTNAEKLSDDANIEAEKGIPYMSVDEMLSMSVDQLKALSNNDYDIVLSASSQAPYYGYKFSAFPEYVLGMNQAGVMDTQPGDDVDYGVNDKSIYGTEYRILGNNKEQLNLYEGAEVGAGITVGMSYSDIEQKTGKKLSVGRIETSLDICAQVEIDGRTWYLHFDLTDEQKERVQTIISDQIDALNAEYGGWYISSNNYSDITVDLDDLEFDPKCDIAVLNLWNY
ncbi:MAG: sigma-70 family RNA polymerase sigma factor [Ruminococcus sp.]|uniref:RNA polymerase sigma factor n=1 Tax=Ruminococcus sp. TaxID=41978 RepID=UPI0025F17C39|nr:sigma-70 family RNA polymerase sigma factor [Ruminococcus sp.]MBO4865871.1 sigma-70 family RNA polymerase sigma factor [Ruminococcus sp.]